MLEINESFSEESVEDRPRMSFGSMTTVHIHFVFTANIPPHRERKNTQMHGLAKRKIVMGRQICGHKSIVLS